MALKFRINLQKYYTKPKNNCTYVTVVGTDHSLKLYTFKLLILTFGYDIKARNAVLLCKKLHCLSLQ